MKKIIYTLLGVMLSISAWADNVAKIVTTEYATLAEAFAAVTDGTPTTIDVMADCAGNGIIVPSGRDITVNFNGHTYTVNTDVLAGSNGTKNQCFQLLRDSKVTFNNGTIVADNAAVKMIIQNYSDLTLTGMTIDATQGTNSVGYVVSNNNGNTVLGTGTTITAKSTGVAFDVYSFKNEFNYTGAKVTVDGATINGKIEVSAKNEADVTTLGLVLKSGTINGTIDLGNRADEATITKSETMNVTAPADHKWDTDGKLIPKEYVAQVGEEKYETLEEAITAAADGQTITLLSDVTENIDVAADKNITLDLNGKTLNGKQTAESPTIKNKGTLTLQNGNVRRTGDGSASYYVIENEGTITMDEGLDVEGSANASLIRNNADTAQMTINAGTYTQTGAFIVVKNDLGTVVINGGTFSTEDTKNVLNNWNQMTINGGTFTGNLFNGAYDTDNNKLTINNGTFNTNQIRTYLGNGQTKCPIDVNGGTFTNTNMKYVGTGNKESDTDVQVAVSGGTFANEVPEKYCADGFIPTEGPDGTYGVKEGSYLAQIGEKKYETLEDAIIAAGEDEKTIKLLADKTIATVASIPANITIDANGKAFTVTEYTVTDGKPAPRVPAASMTATTATYTRTIGTNVWGTICVPFTLKSCDDYTLYNIESITADQLNVTEIATAAPGTPVIFKAKAGVATVVFSTTDATVTTAAPAGGVQLVGTYTAEKITDNLPSIYFINGDKFHQAQVSLTVPAYRAYISASTSAGTKQLTICVLDDNATAADTVLSDAAAAPAAYYDMQGRALAAPTNGITIVRLSDGRVVKLANNK